MNPEEWTSLFLIASVHMHTQVLTCSETPPKNPLVCNTRVCSPNVWLRAFHYLRLYSYRKSSRAVRKSRHLQEDNLDLKTKAFWVWVALTAISAPVKSSQCWEVFRDNTTVSAGHTGRRVCRATNWKHIPVTVVLMGKGRDWGFTSKIWCPQVVELYLQGYIIQGLRHGS